LIFNEKIFLPAISSIFSDYEVSLPPNKTASVVVGKNSVDKKLWLPLPFGGFYIIPFVLLALKRNWILVKKLTYYYLFLSIIPFIFLMSIFNKVINYIPFGLFQQLTIVLGLVFTILTVKDNMPND